MINEIFAFVAGMLLSSAIWIQFIWNAKAKDACQSKKGELVAERDKLLDETLDYITERERAIEMHNSLTYHVEQLKTKLTDVERREKEVARKENTLQYREKANASKVTELEGLLKGAREKNRRTKK